MGMIIQKKSLGISGEVLNRKHQRCDLPNSKYDSNL